VELPQETAPIEKASGNTTKGHPGNREVWGGVKAGTAVGLTQVPAPIYRKHHRDVHRRQHVHVQTDVWWSERD
jgi:hypothetical protein